MSFVEVFLILAILTSGLFCGVITAMMAVIQPTLNQLDYAGYTQVMQGIIVEGRKSLIIKLVLLMPIVLAVVALILLRDSTHNPAFIWTIIGLIAFIIGPLLISRYANEPWYEKIMGWSLETPTQSWESERLQWLRLNLLRFSIGFIGFIAFSLALATNVS